MICNQCIGDYSVFHSCVCVCVFITILVMTFEFRTEEMRTFWLVLTSKQTILGLAVKSIKMVNVKHVVVGVKVRG